MPDFEVYWKAGTRAAAAEPLYRDADADYQFKYFPAFAILAIPMASLPLPVAKAIWFGAAVSSLVLLLRIGPRVLPEMRRSTRWLLCVAIVALGKYYARDLVLGQINIIFTLVATVAVVSMAKGREVLGGVLVALAVVLKPYALILLPWIAARRKRPSIVAAGAGVAVVLVAPAVLYGVSGTLALYKGWWTTVSTTTGDTMILTDNISIAAMYVKWLGPGAPAWPAVVTSAALLLAAVLVFRARDGVSRPDGLEGALLLAIMPLVSPQGWDYVLLLGAPAMVVLLDRWTDMSAPWRALTVAGFLMANLTTYDTVGRHLYLVVTTYAVVSIGAITLLASAVHLRVRKLA